MTVYYNQPMIDVTLIKLIKEKERNYSTVGRGTDSNYTKRRIQ